MSANNRSTADWPVYHGMAFFAFAAAAAAIPASRVWPLPLLLPLITYFLVVALVPRLRRTFESPRADSFSKMSSVAAVVITIVSCAVLLVFDRVAQPDVAAYPTFLQVRIFGGILAAGVLFSLVNPVLEELIFRGLLYRAVEVQWGQLLAIGMSAVMFGIAHVQGYPPGPAGALLATGYGLALGWLRAITGGLILPIASHMAVDATIFVLVARTGVFEQ